MRGVYSNWSELLNFIKTENIDPCALDVFMDSDISHVYHDQKLLLIGNGQYDAADILCAIGMNVEDV